MADGDEINPAVAEDFANWYRENLQPPAEATLEQLIAEPENGWRTLDSFSETEIRDLRPIAETLAMLAGNAFFGNAIERDGVEYEWYAMYLPQADALFRSNGGYGGWAGDASFVGKENE